MYCKRKCYLDNLKMVLKKAHLLLKFCTFFQNRQTDSNIMGSSQAANNFSHSYFLHCTCSLPNYYNNSICIGDGKVVYILENICRDRCVSDTQTLLSPPLLLFESSGNTAICVQPVNAILFSIALVIDFLCQ